MGSIAWPYMGSIWPEISFVVFLHDSIQIGRPEKGWNWFASHSASCPFIPQDVDLPVLDLVFGQDVVNQLLQRSHQEIASCTDETFLNPLTAAVASPLRNGDPHQLPFPPESSASPLLASHWLTINSEHFVHDTYLDCSKVSEKKTSERSLDPTVLE